jgi:ATP-dependent helicase HepA
MAKQNNSQASTAFALGQRWLSDTETDLGLGTVIMLDNRTVTLMFPASGENRVYAAQSAPLTRITFEQGETVKSHEGWELLVETITEKDGQLSYHGIRLDTKVQQSLKETFIDHHFQLNRPEQRLLNAQIDHPKWFELREQCLLHQYTHSVSDLLGFVGARVDLIPHQLHIASTVGRRYAPRVLLADEVGLGKTIEAALIIHQQLLTSRAQRVLIVVPSSLVHQWLVEMLRRVNLAFSVFDEERCEAMAEDAANPFEAEQLVICSLDFLTHNSRYYQQAVAAQWDLMIVDEAHHLRWSQGQPSQEYQVIEGLAEATKGVLLLTATPDQLGHESHFARLRLLDPARFHDYQSFVHEEQHYSQLARAIDPLLLGKPLSANDVSAIAQFSDAQMLDNINAASDDQKTKLLHSLLDRHGTGRVLFRNSRAGISGFPKRILASHALVQPLEYRILLELEAENIQLHLTPERHPDVVNTWTNFDPRVPWFIDQLKALKGQKILTICANASTALQLSEALRVRAGIRSTVFHEGMSIVERDKAANYFAQSEEGAQVLICSEIGSEGRNFQFAHHLVLFDLPRVPDLLEQRIGRLDRIGQKHDVVIHLPYFSATAQQVLLDWYHQGLNAFEQTCPTGMTVYEETQELLHQCLQQPENEALCHTLINQTAQLHRDLKHKLEQGRDKLLELNSSGRGRIDGLLKQINDAEESPTLELFMTKLFDAIGVLQEEKDQSCYLLRPTESMHSPLPGLDEEGMTVTYERSSATQLEHVHFLSWDHPMINHAMDMLTTDVLGKSSIGLCQDKTFAPGAYWLECLYVLSATAPKSLQLNRFLPPTPVKICLNSTFQVDEKTFFRIEPVSAKMGNQLIAALRNQIEAGLEKAKIHADKIAVAIKTERHQQMHSLLGDELARLESLRKVNPAIRSEELTFLAKQIAQLDEVIGAAKLQLEAVRLVVNNP